jgi:hypothetical protein
MLCGYLPFEGENNNLLFQNILNCDPEFPEFLSELSKDIISQILNPDPETRITIEEIKRHKFYLEGKRLCKIDYDNIENNIIKKRNIFGKNKIKNNNMNNNNIDNNIQELNNENKLNDLEESNLSENSKDINKYIYTANNHIISTKEDNLLDSNSNDIIHTENINLNIKESKNDSISSNNFKKQIMEIGNKYNDKIDIINNKIQRILKTDANDNIKIQLRPFSSNKKNNTTNKNVVSLSNNSNSNTNTNIDINSKQNHQYPFFNLISESKDNNNLKKNTLFIKLLDSAKNKYFNLYKSNTIKTETKKQNININNINTEITKTSENRIQIKTPNSFFTNFKNNSPKININILNNNKNTYQNHIISLSNDNLTDAF